MKLMPMTTRVALAAASLLLCSAAARGQIPTKAPAPGPVKPAAIPPFQEATLSNGLRLLLVESKRQPVVSLALMLPAGDAYDPAGKEGLSSMVASVLTKGAVQLSWCQASCQEMPALGLYQSCPAAPAQAWPNGSSATDAKFAAPGS